MISSTVFGQFIGLAEELHDVHLGGRNHHALQLAQRVGLPAIVNPFGILNQEVSSIALVRPFLGPASKPAIACQVKNNVSAKSMGSALYHSDGYDVRFVIPSLRRRQCAKSRFAKMENTRPSRSARIREETSSFSSVQ